MAKIPSNLTHKEKVKTKRTHDNYQDFNARKKKYEELKKFRQELKEKKKYLLKRQKLKEKD